jgi:hypothetical protein
MDLSGTSAIGSRRMQGWIIVNRFAKEKKSSLTLTAAKRNLCEEEIYQIAEARGHGVSILLLE